MPQRSPATGGRRRQRPPALAALRRLEHVPRKSLGQHFLTDKQLLDRIIKGGQLSDVDVIIEVGAGLGELTQALASQTSCVVAVEADATLFRHLQRRFAEDHRVHLIHGDILTLSPEELLQQAGIYPRPYVVAGNLPFNIATAIVRHFLEASFRPERLVVMLQREVAENVAAQPGQMSYLSVSVQLYGQPQLLFTVPPRAFYPPPKVYSAVVRIDVRPEPAAGVDDPQGFLEFARAGFAAPRKQIRNSLALGLDTETSRVEACLRATSIEPTRRPQTLSLEEWAALYRAYESIVLHGDRP